jgi:hypothetical protein
MNTEVTHEHAEIIFKSKELGTDYSATSVYMYRNFTSLISTAFNCDAISISGVILNVNELCRRIRA